MVERSPLAWALPDTAGFPAWVADTFGGYNDDDSEKSGGFMVQQRFVRDYLQQASPYRGLLLYHGLGSGKTCAAIAITAALHIQGGRRVFVFLPASLRTNYVREIAKCGQKDGFDASKHTIVNYNGLSAKKVAELCASNQFDGAAVVIDEVHNFVSNVSHGKLLARLYNHLMTARDCKIVMLSGTPLVNEPHELALLVNLAHGSVAVHEVTLGGAMDERAMTQLRACPDVHEVVEGTRGGRSTVVLRMMPPGFERVADGMAARRGAGDDGMTNDGMTNATASTGGRGRSRGGGGGGSRVGGGGGGGEDMMMMRRVRDILEHVGPGIVRVQRRDVLLLPEDPEAFRAHFVDPGSNQVRNADVLMRRMLGTVSFFKGHDESLYPTMRSMSIVRTTMSPRQFTEYAVQRAIEIRREETAKRVAGMRKNRGGSNGDDGDGFSGYRPLSRAVCNFAFPEEVPRPRKSAQQQGESSSSKGKKSKGEEDSGGGEEGAVDATYERALERAALKLRDLPGRMVLGEGLDELSPKFAAIIRRLTGRQQEKASSSSRKATATETPADLLSPPSKSASQIGRGGKGTAIVYSQFRHAEGVNLFAAALQANGFLELKVVTKAGVLEVETPSGNRPRFIVFSNEDRAAAECALAIFNGQYDGLPAGVISRLQEVAKDAGLPLPLTNLRGETARVLLITKSGAEGITTKNVREVHIIDPFWHANRTEQVVGRARRAHSHDDLPPAERTVDVFIYMATMTAEQAKALPKDAGRTSDEFVHEVAQRKRAILKGLTEVMKRAAVDCRLFQAKDRTDCYAPPAGLARDRLLYAVDLEDDMRTARTAKLQAVKSADGTMFYADPKTGALYDYKALKERNELVEVGRAQQVKA